MAGDLNRKVRSEIEEILNQRSEIEEILNQRPEGAKLGKSNLVDKIMQRLALRLPGLIFEVALEVLAEELPGFLPGAGGQYGTRKG